jgi:hypothetical protein
VALELGVVPARLVVLDRVEQVGDAMSTVSVPTEPPVMYLPLRIGAASSIACIRAG